MERDERWDISTKLLAACNDFGDSRYVLFAEAGTKVHEAYGPDVAGIFLKVAGHGEVRKFLPPASNAEVAEWAEVLDALREWVNLQEPGVLAMLGVPHGRLAAVMAGASVASATRVEGLRGGGLRYAERLVSQGDSGGAEMASVAMPWAP